MTIPFSIGGASQEEPLPPRPELPWEVTHPFQPRPVSPFAKLFGGADPLLNGLVSRENAGRLGKQSLVDAGLAMLKASGPSPVRRGLFDIVGEGVQAGRNAYQEGAQSALQTEEAARSRRMRDVRSQLLSQYAGKTDLPSMQGMLSDLLAIGDMEGAKALAEYLKSAVNAQGSTFRSPVEIKSGKEVLLVDPRDPNNVLARYPGVTSETNPALQEYRQFSMDLRKEQQATHNFEAFQRRITPYVDAAASVNNALGEVGNAKAGNAAAQIRLMYAFIQSQDNSVVREGEAALLRSAAPLLGQAQSLIDKYARNESVVVPQSLIDGVAAVMSRMKDSITRKWKVQHRAAQMQNKRQSLPTGEIDLFDPDVYFNASGTESGKNPLLNQ